ncbi:hypothetical protein INT44_001166 [Umbelopsis vinacea]|uniref:Poly [ADP-ribose] polymerase n=1 Tax=Umbelopsis vinacea TaxID=44442 RepID=A0A8H7QB13_9FUNG|nr:hypothetical protein INT44_001166 [Umbelopsis vinacea]
MQEITPESGHQATYDMVAKYMQDTADRTDGNNYDLLHLFQLERENEAVRHQPFATVDNRMLLWHGSKISNMVGILKQGLRIKPAQAYESGSMFGSGLYFADTFLKSSGYCNDYTSVDAQPYSVLMLCEVSLGKTLDLWETKFMEQSEEGYLSTKGMGQYGPDPTYQKYDKNGVRIT